MRKLLITGITILLVSLTACKTTSKKPLVIMDDEMLTVSKGLQENLKKIKGNSIHVDVALYSRRSFTRCFLHSNIVSRLG